MIIYNCIKVKKTQFLWEGAAPLTFMIIKNLSVADHTDLI